MKTDEDNELNLIVVILLFLIVTSSILFGLWVKNGIAALWFICIELILLISSYLITN